MNNNYPQTFNTIGQCSISIEKVVYEFGFFNVTKRIIYINKPLQGMAPTECPLSA